MTSVTSLGGRAPRSGTKSVDGASRGAGGHPVGRISHRVLRPEDVRRHFPDQWQAWCRANFRSSVHLAAAFGVSEKTARLWMEGVNSPQGYAVASAMEGLVDGVEPFRLDLAA